MPFFRSNFGWQVGPLLPVTVTAHPRSADGLNGLIDTGATICAISQQVIADLDLIPVGHPIVIRTLSNQEEKVPVYRVMLSMRDAHEKWTDSILAHRMPSHPSFEVVLGRDVLRKGTFQMEGDRFSFWMPGRCR